MLRCECSASIENAIQLQYWPRMHPATFQDEPLDRERPRALCVASRTQAAAPRWRDVYALMALALGSSGLGYGMTRRLCAISEPERVRSAQGDEQALAARLQESPRPRATRQRDSQTSALSRRSHAVPRSAPAMLPTAAVSDAPEAGGHPSPDAARVRSAPLHVARGGSTQSGPRAADHPTSRTDGWERARRAAAPRVSSSAPPVPAASVRRARAAVPSRDVESGQAAPQRVSARGRDAGSGARAGRTRRVSRATSSDGLADLRATRGAAEPGPRGPVWFASEGVSRSDAVSGDTEAAKALPQALAAAPAPSLGLAVGLAGQVAARAQARATSLVPRAEPHRSPRPLRAALNALQVEGPLPTGVVSRGLQRLLPHFQRCARSAKRAAAQARVRVQLDEHGHSRRVQIEGASRPQLRRCLERASARLVVPAPDTGLVRASWVVSWWGAR